MVKHIRFFSLFIVASLLSIAVHSADFIASVDRKAIAENDTFTLMLRYGEQAGFGSPDFSVLENDFHILNQQRSNQFRSINGTTESFTEWVLTLTPKHTGELTIPAINFDNQRTQPITIDVNPLSSDVKEKLAKEFFFDIKVSKGPYVVQGQILYTEKLYYSVNHEDPSLSDFKVTDARVQALGDVRSYQTVVDGQRLGVYERRYAIFPEESGQLVIPGQRFNAVVSNPYSRWSRGRQASVVSKPIKLDIQPIPTQYPSAPWLPGQQLTISESFSNGDNNQWVVGEPVTRTIVLKAKGLSGSQLPAIALPVIEKIRYYPDQSAHNEDKSEDGIIGTLTQSMALVPTAEGNIVLPEVRIPWWNTQLETLEYAVLPARTLKIQASTNASRQPSAVTNTSLPNVANSAGAPSAQMPKQHTQGMWILASALLLLSNFVLAFLLWRQRHHNGQETEEEDNIISERQAWKELKKACQNHNPAIIRSALLQWARCFYKRDDIHQLDQLQRLHKLPALRDNLNSLDISLYSASRNDYQSGELLDLLKQLSKKNSSQQENDLRPLYG